MGTDKNISEFDIIDVSEGCNYSDDILAVTKQQSPNSMNVEFFNGRIRKRPGELAFTVPPGGQGGIDSFNKLMLHMNGTNNSTSFIDSENTPKAVTVNGTTVISTAQSKFGGASGLFSGQGNDTNTQLLLTLNNNSLDTSQNAFTITNNSVTFANTTPKFVGTSYGVFDGGSSNLTVPSNAAFGFGTADFTIDTWVYVTDFTNFPCIFSQETDANNFVVCEVSGGSLVFLVSVAGVNVVALNAGAVTLNTWTHVAIVRSGNIWSIYIGGSSTVTTTYNGAYPTFTGAFTIGYDVKFNHYFIGNMSEFRVSKGIARWTANFTPPIFPYSSGDSLSLVTSVDWAPGTGDYTVDMWLMPTDLLSSPMVFSEVATAGSAEHVLQINSDGSVGWRYSNGSALASYTAPAGTIVPLQQQHVALVKAATTVYLFINGMSQTLTAIVPVSTNNLTNLGQALLIGGYNSASNYYNGYMDEFRVSKGIARWTANFTPPLMPYDTFNASVTPVGYSIADFSDSDQHHKQIAHLGSGVYAYDQVTNTNIALRYGAPQVRSYDANIGGFFIQTYNDYSVPYYWDGITSSMAILSSNAPGFKRTIEFQGYLLGMNISSNKTRVYYQLIGNIIGDPALYTDFFTLTPAPNDDEITDSFILNGRLYIGTKYGIFRISFVGGVTIFEFKQVVSIVGIVPMTAQVVVTRYFGQVAIFLGSDKRLYLFDGVNVKTISDLFYYHNASTDIALDLIDDNYKENSFALFDTVRRIYRLFVTKRSQSKNYYCLNVEIETFAYYPFDNMNVSCATIGYDNLLRPYVIAADYSGVLHKMFIENNTDSGTPINEYYDSPLVSLKNSAIKSAQNLTINLRPSSEANLIVYEKVDFKNAWVQRSSVPLASSRDKFLGKSMVLGSSVLGSEKDLVYPKIGLNTSFNYYQFRLISDTPTNPPWEIMDITFDEALLKFGRAEAQR